MKRGLPLSIVLAIVGAVSGSGCCSFLGRCPAQPVQPTLVYNLSLPLWQTGPMEVLGPLHGGSVSIDDPRLQSDVQRTYQCTYAADYSGSGSPQFQANGTPGTSSFNVQLVSSNLVQASGLTHPCPAGLSPTEIIIRPSQGIAVGQATRSGDVELTLSDGSVNTADIGFFEFTLSSLDRSAGSASGTFRFALTNHSDPRNLRVLAIMGGSFVMPIQ